MREITVVALYDNFEAAKGAVEDLIAIGVPRDQIACLANNASGHHPGLLSNPAFANELVDKPEADATSGLGLGVEIGLGVGGLLGLLLGTGALAIPGIGFVIAAGTWATVAAGAGAGAVVGGIVGVLTDRGVSDEDAHLYAEGLRRGGTLVTVHAGEDELDRVTQLFKKRGAVDIEKRESAWRAEGWISFDHEAQPLTAAEVAAIRAREAAAGHEAEHHHAVRHYAQPEEPHLAGVSSMTPRYAEDEIKKTS